MRVSTEGPVSARSFFMSVPGSDKAIGMVVTRVTYDVVDGRLIPSGTQASVQVTDRIVGGQLFPSDQLYPKKNVDLVVVGDAVAPGDDAIDCLEVDVSLGELKRKLVVTGDRCWHRTDGKKEKPQSPAPSSSIAAVMALVEKTKASAPAAMPDFEVPVPPPEKADDKNDDDDKDDKEDPTYEPTSPSRFKRMRLDWAHAYGGDGFQDNPDGKGFVTYPPDGVGDPAVEGVPLPNVEDSRRRVTSWKQWPAPSGCGFYPQRWGIRMRRGIEPRGIKVPCLLAAFFNQAHPDFELKTFPEGEELVVTHMSPRGTFRALIKRPAVTACISIPGLPPRQLDLVWDLICARPEYGEISMVGRIPFKYDPVAESEAVMKVTSAEKQTERF